MKVNELFNELKGELISIGFSLYGEPSLFAADPEAVLVKALQFFYEDRKIFRMLLRWCLTIAPLIHVERLHKQIQNLEPNLIPVLGAVSKKLILSGDRRFSLIYEEMKNKFKLSNISPTPPEGYGDSFLISKYGEDPELKEFDMRVAYILPENEKKVLDLRGILKIHRWLRLRVLIGPNFRADLIYLLSLKTVKNPNQAAKILGCSRETAYRLWKEVTLFEGIDKLFA